MSNSAEIVYYLNKGAAELGLELSAGQTDMFVRYYNALMDSNKKVNLTQITRNKDVALKHFVDSLACAHFFDFSSVDNFIDVGTGAGFPGIPLKIVYPRAKAVFVDSQQKRINFLHNVAGELCLKGVEFYHRRAELLGRDNDHRQQYSLCVSRAVAPFAVLCEFCLPLVKVGGYFIALKGPDIDNEILAAQNAIQVLGGKKEKVIKFNLPVSGDGRSIIIIKKTISTPEKYPRRAGIPAKRPL